LGEAGLKNVEGDAWMGFILPAKTSPEIAKRLHTEIVQILKSDEMKKKLALQYMEPVAGTPAEFRDTVQGDLMRWKPIIEKNNISLD
jgi:tripartite-type tricarboxylate transporter receptor subunit TctC